MRNLKSLNVNYLESLVNFIDGVNREFSLALCLQRRLKKNPPANPSFLKLGLFQILLFLGKKFVPYSYMVFLQWDY